MKNYPRLIKIVYSPLAIILAFVIFLACKKNESEKMSTQAFADKKISISPVKALPGDTIYITGNFEGAATDARVKIGNDQLLLSSSGSGMLQAILPKTAVTGRISISLNGETISSPDEYRVQKAELTEH